MAQAVTVTDRPGYMPKALSIDGVVGYRLFGLTIGVQAGYGDKTLTITEHSMAGVGVTPINLDFAHAENSQYMGAV